MHPVDATQTKQGPGVMIMLEKTTVVRLKLQSCQNRMAFTLCPLFSMTPAPNPRTGLGIRPKVPGPAA